jgi:hypothetical protein
VHLWKARFGALFHLSLSSALAAFFALCKQLIIIDINLLPAPPQGRQPAKRGIVPGIARFIPQKFPQTSTKGLQKKFALQPESPALHR